MPKSLFTALVILLALSLAGAGIWFFFFYEPPKQEFDFNTAVSDFLPFGKLRETDGRGTAAPRGSSGQAVVSAPRSFGPLTELAAAPVAGFTLLPGASTTTGPVVRYMERATGHVYDVAPSSGKETRVTNTTVPRVHEALFAEGGAAVLIRYLRDDNQTIETYSAKIGKSTTSEETELKGVFLPANIREVAVSPDGRKIFYLSAFAGGSAGFTASPENSAKLQIWGSPLNEWLSGWANEKTIVVTTKPSGGVTGYAYKIDPVAKTAEKLLGGIPGLTTLASPDGKYVLYGSSNGRQAALGIHYVKEHAGTLIGLASFPEKCVWAKDGVGAYCAVPEQLPSARYPDAWYQGTVLFSDRIWKIDAATGDTTLLHGLRELSAERLDVVKPSLSVDGSILFFINKKDQSLWSLKLGE